VLCDERARLLGLVTLERVLGRLADAIDQQYVQYVGEEQLTGEGVDAGTLVR
jgi:hypothetical protein